MALDMATENKNETEIELGIKVNVSHNYWRCRNKLSF